MSDSTPKVTGIGGIFFRAKKSKEIMKWYGENLGLALDGYGSAFEFRNAHRPEEINYLRWSPFDEKTDYFDPSEKDFMINYRVQNIEALVDNLESNGGDSPGRNHKLRLREICPYHGPRRKQDRAVGNQLTRCSPTWEAKPPSRI